MEASLYQMLKNIQAEFSFPGCFDSVLTGSALWCAHDRGTIDAAEILTSENITEETIHHALEKLEKAEPELKDVFQELSPVKMLTASQFRRLLSMLKAVHTAGKIYEEWVEELIAFSPPYYQPSSSENASPSSLNDLAVSLLSPVSGRFYDGAAGLGGSLVTAARYAHNYQGDIQLYGQELNSYNWAVAKLRLFLHGIGTEHLAKGNSLSQPAHTEKGELEKFEFVFLDGPFGTQIPDYDLVKEDNYKQFQYGPLHKKSGDMALMMHVASSLNRSGKGIMTTTDGALFRGGTEAEIRKNILREDLIEAVIALPPKLYEKTALPVNLILFNRNKPAEQKGKILFINAENLYSELTKSRRFLLNAHIGKIIDTVKNGIEQKETSAFVELADIKQGNLLPSRYLTSNKLELTGYGKVKIDPEKLERVETTSLKDAASFFPGFNILSKHKETKDGAYRIVKLSDVHDGKIDVDSVGRYHIFGNARLDKYVLQKGDLVLAIRGNSLKTAVVPEHEGTLLLSQNFIGIRCGDNLDPHYLKIYLDSPPGQYVLRSKLSGTTVLTLSKSDVQNLAIPKKSWVEQRAIVEHYQKKKTDIEERIRKLEEEWKKTKLEMYEDIGIRDVFKLQT